MHMNMLNNKHKSYVTIGFFYTILIRKLLGILISDCLWYLLHCQQSNSNSYFDGKNETQYQKHKL